LTRLESRGGHWFSERQLVRNADTMNLSLDHQVAAYPRSAGWIIAGAGLLLAGNFGILLLAIR